MSNSNDDLNEQPTQMASAGSHEQAGEGQSTWQSQGQQGQHQAGGLGGQFAANEGETRAMPHSASNAQGSNGYGQASGGPGQYPPVPGSAPQAGTYQTSGGQQGSNPAGQYGSGYGSSAQNSAPNNQGGQWNSAPQGQQGAPYGQNGQGQPAQQNGGYNSSPQGYASGAQAGYANTNQQGAAYNPGQQYNQGQTVTQNQYAPQNGATADKPRPGIGKTLGWGLVAASLLAIIGVFGTWMWVKLDAGTLGNFNASTNGIGMESSNIPNSDSGGDDNKVTDGWFVLIPAIIALALGVLRALGKIRKPVMWAGAALGGIATAVAVYDYFDVRDKLDEAKQGANGLAGFSAGSGWGLTLCIIAGLLMLITSVISALRD